jgi:HEAT repeat protein
MRRARVLLAGLGLAALSVLPALAQAQRRPPTIRPGMAGQMSRQPPPRPTGSSQVPAGDVLGHVGVSVAERLLAGDEQARRRAVRRLVADGTPQALDLLERVFEPGAPLTRDLRARIEAARGLGPHLAQDGPRQLVLRSLIDGATQAAGGDEAELGALLRDTAALVLARSGGARGVEALAGLVRQGGQVGAAAGRALLAAPPESIEGLAGPRAQPSAVVAELLAGLGDLRALPFLRRSVRQGEPTARAASLVAMATLGDAEAPIIAREWARAEDSLPRLAAAQALDGPEARVLLAALLDDEATRDAALGLALDRPGPELARALGKLAAARGPSRDRAIVALGRCGGQEAAASLGALLTDEAAAPLAALGLALSPGDDARQALEKALADPPTRLVALRAATARALALGDRPAGLFEAALALGGGSPSERAAAAFAQVALGKKDAAGFLADPVLAPAAARALLARGRGVDELLGPLMQGGDLISPDAVSPTDRSRRDALGLALLSRPDGGPLPSRTLLGWVDEGGALGPLAARAIGARGGEDTRTRVTEMLRSGDPQIRSHVALGLGRSPDPDATGRLTETYTFETDPLVRRAIVRALSRRDDPLRRGTLELAAGLDPDATTRSLARAALGGRRAPDTVTGELVAWISVRGAGSGAASFRLERPDGLALPVVADPDGALLVPGLPAGPSHASFVPPPAPLPAASLPATSASAASAAALPPASASVALPLSPSAPLPSP